jgi:hypothetical protein
MINSDYKNKYLKYKHKYLQLKNKYLANYLLGPNNDTDTIDQMQLQPDQIINQHLDPIQTLTNNDIFIMFIKSDIMELNVAETNITELNVVETNIDTINLSNNTEQKMLINSNPNKINRSHLERERKVPKRYRDYESELTPIITKHFKDNYKSEIAEELIAESFKKDNKAILDSLSISDQTDFDYVNYENYGKLVECWIADNMICPCCQVKSLRRYASDIMPIVDLVCINPEHNFRHGVKFFQVKTSSGALFKGLPYFNRNNCLIHVGSRRKGELVHSIKISDDDLTKKILIGYICIEFKDNESNNTLTINKIKSFIVLPKYDKVNKTLFFNNTTSSYQSDSEFRDLYYKYLNTNVDHNIIKFSVINNMILNVDLLINIFTIPKTYISNPNKWKKIINPLSDIIISS